MCLTYALWSALGPNYFSPGPRIINCCPHLSSCSPPKASSPELRSDLLSPACAGSAPCSAASPLVPKRLNVCDHVHHLQTLVPPFSRPGISCPAVLPAADSIPVSESLRGDSSVTHSTTAPPT